MLQSSARDAQGSSQAFRSAKHGDSHRCCLWRLAASSWLSEVQTQLGLRFTNRLCWQPPSGTGLLLNKWTQIQQVPANNTAQAPDWSLFMRGQDEAEHLHGSETSNGWVMHWWRKQSHPNTAQLFSTGLLYPIPTNPGISAPFITSCFCPPSLYSQIVFHRILTLFSDIKPATC